MSGGTLEIEILAWLDEFAPEQECRGLDFARARTRGRAAPPGSRLLRFGGMIPPSHRGRSRPLPFAASRAAMTSYRPGSPALSLREPSTAAVALMSTRCNLRILSTLPVARLR